MSIGRDALIRIFWARSPITVIGSRSADEQILIRSSISTSQWIVHCLLLFYVLTIGHLSSLMIQSQFHLCWFVINTAVSDYCGVIPRFVSHPATTTDNCLQKHFLIGRVHITLQLPTTSLSDLHQSKPNEEHNRLEVTHLASCGRPPCHTTLVVFTEAPAKYQIERLGVP